jgi:hypothetical protein
MAAGLPHCASINANSCTCGATDHVSTSGSENGLLASMASTEFGAQSSRLSSPLSRECHPAGVSVTYAAPGQPDHVNPKLLKPVQASAAVADES